MDNFLQSKNFINETAASDSNLKNMILQKNVEELTKQLYVAYMRIEELNLELANLKQKQK